MLAERENKKQRDRRKAMYDVYLVEEDLAAGESDVEKKVRVSEDLILTENTRPICHFLLYEAGLSEPKWLELEMKNVMEFRQCKNSDYSLGPLPAVDAFDF